MNRLRLEFLALVAGLVMSTAAAYCADPAPSTGAQPVDPLHAGTKAPDFTRITHNGKKISLRSFRGKSNVVLYFYPKDETSNCVKEACGFRDFFNQMAGKGAEIIGVSGDSDDSHRAFSDHYSLPFDLVSDSDNSLLRLYHVPFFKGSFHTRVTFVIDKQGVITNVIQYTNDGDVHVKEATDALHTLGK